MTHSNSIEGKPSTELDCKFWNMVFEMRAPSDMITYAVNPRD